MYGWYVIGVVEDHPPVQARRGKDSVLESDAAPWSGIVSPARKLAPSIGAAMRLASAAVPTVMMSVSVPGPGVALPSLTVRR